jgi:hypothetical protein
MVLLATLSACGSTPGPSSPTTPSGVSPTPVPTPVPMPSATAPTVAAGAQFAISGPFTASASQGSCTVGIGNNQGFVDINLGVSGGGAYTVQLDIIQKAAPVPGQQIAVHAISKGVYRPSIQIVSSFPEYYVSQGTVTVSDANASAGTITGTELYNVRSGALVAGQLAMTWQGCSRT